MRREWAEFFSSTPTYCFDFTECCPCKYFGINPETLSPIDFGELKEVLNVLKEQISMVQQPGLQTDIFT